MRLRRRGLRAAVSIYRSVTTGLCTVIAGYPAASAHLQDFCPSAAKGAQYSPDTKLRQPDSGEVFQAVSTALVCRSSGIPVCFQLPATGCQHRGKPCPVEIARAAAAGNCETLERYIWKYSSELRMSLHALMVKAYLRPGWSGVPGITVVTSLTW